MDYLIDTHILIWYLEGSPSLSHRLIDLIDNADTLNVSIASLWELTIKESLGKIKLSKPLTEIQEALKADSRYKTLNISFEHLNILSTLPHHHGDPFDRLLISQAISRKLAIISVDKHFESYPINLM